MALAARKTTGSTKPIASTKTATSRSASRKNSLPTDFTRDEDVKAYHEMLMIRRFEEKAGQMYGMGLIGGFCHLYIGQEAVVVGMERRKRMVIRSLPAIATTAICWRAAWIRKV